MRIFYFVFLIGPFFSIVMFQEKETLQLTQKEAVQLAERFIIENGYTNAPKEKISKTLSYGVKERGGG